MPRPDPRAPKAGQESMFDDLPAAMPGKLVRGRHSDAVDRALAAARDKDLIQDEDEALATLVRAGAWSLDAFESQNKPYGPSKLIAPVVEALRELRLTPDSRASETDENLKELLSGLDASDDATTAVHDREESAP